MDVQHAAEGLRDLGVPGEERVGLGTLVVVLEEAEFLVDEGDDGVLAQVGVAVEVPAGAGLVPGLPSQREVGAEQSEAGAGPSIDADAAAARKA